MKIDWHQRYLQQSGWTRQLRKYIYDRARLDEAQAILEVGCGTGAVISEINTGKLKYLVGLDIDFFYLGQARENAPSVHLTQGDALFLPYQNHSFDITFCHYFLLWVSSPLFAIREMRRVTRRGGAVLALAEPDYGGRIDYPAALSQLGAWQQEALQSQGADPLIGRRLAALFHQSGLTEVEIGVIGGQWTGGYSPTAWEMEWKVLYSDLQGWVPENNLHQLREIDAQASSNGERTLFVPTFYAWGRC